MELRLKAPDRSFMTGYTGDLIDGREAARIHLTSG
jgi:hypothetical protein